MLPYVLRFPPGYVAVLMKSLCIAQDFLTAIWLCWSSEQGSSVGRIPAGHDSRRLSNDLFPCVRLLPFRPLSMDERHEAQDDNSHRSG